ncbi:MAG: cadherin-like beta sandwich domain-containing protein [Lachnospiraceae bacterium]|nr:cadherin-like beta sandwich domain-containing protein [Lachnospiraceae bacterium]
MKKKLVVLLTFVLLVGLLATGRMSKDMVYAKTAQMYLELPADIRKETEFQVKVVLDSDAELYSVDAYLSYDADKLEFIPKDDQITGAEGVLELKDIYEQETKQVSYELNFRDLDIGSAEMALQEVYLIDYEDMDYIEVAPSVKRFEIGINQMVEGETGLEELIVAPGELTEPFQSEKTEYTLYVDHSVEQIGVTAVPKEQACTVDLDMAEYLHVGENLVTVTVTAPSGEVRDYIIRVYRETEQSEKDTEIRE